MAEMGQLRKRLPSSKSPGSLHKNRTWTDVQNESKQQHLRSIKTKESTLKQTRGYLLMDLSMFEQLHKSGAIQTKTIPSLIAFECFSNRTQAGSESIKLKLMHCGLFIYIFEKRPTCTYIIGNTTLLLHNEPSRKPTRQMHES